MVEKKHECRSFRMVKGKLVCEVCGEPPDRPVKLESRDARYDWSAEMAKNTPEAETKPVRGVKTKPVKKPETKKNK